MPTKRTAGPGRIGDLSPAMVDLLLTGTSQADPFLEFEVRPEQIEAAWSLYGGALRAEAQRRGIVLSESRPA